MHPPTSLPRRAGLAVLMLAVLASAAPAPTSADAESAAPAAIPTPTNADGAARRAAIERDYDAHLGALFEHFHRHPELSFLERETAKRLARELRKLGLDVTGGVGGTGVVGLLRNGEGPLVLVRADMDGLPIREESGLAYASTVTQVDASGREVPVMHACGHDVHMTVLVGTAKRLAAQRDRWRGTVMFVGQPAEERIGGAKAMLADGLYARFGVPDAALALHVLAGSPAGRFALRPGPTASSSDNLDVRVRGIGSHGAAPQNGKDPIFVAAQLVTALQGLVGREINPLEPAVISVGSIHGGLKHNVIPDEVKLELTVRADSEVVRAQLLAGIERVAEGVARTAGLPEALWPEVKVVESTPSNLNDPALTDRIRGALVRELGPGVLFELDRDSMGAEDFAEFVRTKEAVPGAYLSVGGAPQSAIDAAKAGGPPLPFHHSAHFKVDPRASITTGVEGMTIAVLEVLGEGPAR
ncbi:MAG: amidohydrolase [Deltaproteobacteria bacterium]|nr:amidohydrolase [Deltaproteobacteria bacterium]